VFPPPSPLILGKPLTQPWIGWGDIDALAEAGFCYAKGVGCKKNLKKAAKLYRAAEAKGMSMVGNSW
jgi:TPR repeat protein